MPCLQIQLRGRIISDVQVSKMLFVISLQPDEFWILWNLCGDINVKLFPLTACVHTTTLSDMHRAKHALLTFNIT
jgi:hypothetical protein